MATLSSIKIAALALATLTAAQTATVQPAEAGRRERILGGIAVGVALGAFAASSSARAHYSSRSYGCDRYRRTAASLDAAGYPHRAVIWWDRYYACTG